MYAYFEFVIGVGICATETPSMRSPGQLTEDDAVTMDQAVAGVARDSWRRAIALYTLAIEAEPGAWEPLLGRARAYACIGMWCVGRPSTSRDGHFVVALSGADACGCDLSCDGCTVWLLMRVCVPGTKRCGTAADCFPLPPCALRPSRCGSVPCFALTDGVTRQRT